MSFAVPYQTETKHLLRVNFTPCQKKKKKLAECTPTGGLRLLCPMYVERYMRCLAILYLSAFKDSPATGGYVALIIDSMELRDHS